MKELALHILDIVQNSIEAGSKNIRVEVSQSVSENKLSFVIKDDGRGMKKEMLEKVEDPWTTSRSVRKVGLGLPLIKQQAELTGGKFEIVSEEGKGTLVKVSFVYNHIDRQPLGDLIGVLKILLGTEDGIDFKFIFRYDNALYEFSSSEAKKVLEVSNFRDRILLKDIIEMIETNLKQIESEIT